MLSVRNVALKLTRSYACAPGSPLIAPLQQSALEEKCILVDENDVPLGSATKRDCHKIGKDGSLLLHRAFSVFLFNTKGDMLIQKRSAEKITFPNHVTNACCSHPLSCRAERVEERALGVKRAAQRRLNYELGVPMDQTKVEDYHYLTRIHYQAVDREQVWGEHEVDYILFLIKDVDLQPNKDEVSHTQYIPLKHFAQFMSELKEPVTPWFNLISKHYLQLWWTNLNNLEGFKNHSKVMKLS